MRHWTKGRLITTASATAKAIVRKIRASMPLLAASGSIAPPALFGMSFISKATLVKWRFYTGNRAIVEVGSLLECADLSALWSLATCRQQRRDRSRQTKAVTGHRTPKTLPRYYHSLDVSRMN